MGSELYELANFTHPLQYWGGNITTTQATRKYAGAAIEAGLEVGDKVFIAGLGQSASNGSKTIESVDTNFFTVEEVIGAGEGPQAATVNEEMYSPWLRVNWYGMINGMANTSQNANLLFQWSHDGSTADISVTEALAAGVPEIIDALVVMPWIRFILRNDGTDQTTVVVYLYGLTWT